MTKLDKMKNQFGNESSWCTKQTFNHRIWIGNNSGRDQNCYRGHYYFVNYICFLIACCLLKCNNCKTVMYPWPAAHNLLINQSRLWCNISDYINFGIGFALIADSQFWNKNKKYVHCTVWSLRWRDVEKPCSAKTSHITHMDKLT